MGGTFDPIHYGHLILAEQAWERFGLDEVWFVTSADPPHKQERMISAAADRYNMTRLAVQDNGHFVCSRVELDRPGPSYTIDTLKEIRASLGEVARIYLLVGADEAGDLMTWRDPYGIQELATIVIANRPSFGIDAVLGSLPRDFAEKIEPLEMPGVDISSTDLRERAASGRSIRYLVPTAVEAYIRERGLYRGNR